MKNFSEQSLDPKKYQQNAAERQDNKEGFSNDIDDGKLEADISSSYLSDLDFQIDLEDQVVEEFSKTKNEILKETLSSLRKSGEESLKNISSKIVEVFNSSKLVVKLRDAYIEKRSIKIYRELSVENKIAQAEDYDSFLKLIKSGFWGSSANASDTAFRASNALSSIACRFPEKQKEILEVWAELFSRDVNCNTDLFTRQIAQIKENEYNILGDNLEGKDKKMDYIKSCDDFTALVCLSDLSFTSKDINVSEETIKRLDSLILKHPNIKELPGDVKHQLFSTCLKNPEEIMSDSRRVDFIFNLWINKISDFPSKTNSVGMIPILANRLQTCSKEETDKLVELLLKRWESSYVSTDFNWLLEFLPLDKNHIKLIEKQKNLADDELLSLNKDKVLDKNIEGREYELLFAAAKSLRSGDELVFLSNLVANYPDRRLGVDEAELESILNVLIDYRQERFDVDTLHCLTELMSRCYWPDSLKRKVYSANNFGADTLNKIITDLDNTSFDWIRNNSLLISQLQIDFHRKAQNNDLRHYFYNVLDGKQQSDNIDDLIKSYGQSDVHFDFEEIRSLFLDNRIDRKYIQYFIQKIDNNELLSSLNNGLVVNQAEKTWFLESAIKYGQIGSTTKVLRELILSGAVNSSGKRLDILNSLSNNLLFKADSYNSAKTPYGNQNDVVGLADQLFKYKDDLSDILSEEETFSLRKKVMTGALDFNNLENTTLLALSHCESIVDVFPEEGERSEYLTKLFEKLILGRDNQQYFFVMSVYFKNPELFSVLSDTCRLDLENKIFSFNITERSRDLLILLPDMDAKQKELFISCFENNFKVAAVQNSNFRDFCRKLTNINYFFENKEAYTKVYLKILNDPDLKSEEASVLFNEEIIFSDSRIRDAFFDNIARWPGVDGNAILESLASMKGGDENFSLSTDELKKISTAVMENRGLSPRFWKGYLASDKENPTFYLDEDIFRVGVVKVGPDCLSESGDEVISFIKSLLESEFDFDEGDAQGIMKKSFQAYSGATRLEAFYKYDPVLMEKILDEGNHFDTPLNTDINFSNEFNHKLLNLLVTNHYSAHNVNRFLNHLKRNNNLGMVAEFKKSLSKLSKDQIVIGRKVLLNCDFLDVAESKQFYKEITSSSSDNARTQIINSIDVIGSMLSNRDNIEQLGQFLNKPRAEDIANLKNISDFIEKYNKENKGRSIAVMLFAREYLPDRPLEEVIERVAYNLRKYGEIIENNSYKNTPAGFRASIGMEYEITSSTAKGYEELTSQASLKEDIAKISQAARIGEGRDAVHEIATKPTDNPYLMLLEMKLLHDIEYIDLNFDRSENYQKGARGFHLTIGGEKGLPVCSETNFLQNALIAASWGGVQSGELGHKVNGGRGVSLRGRDANTSNNVAFFGEKTNSVELRSLSIDKQETLQRAVTTAFNGAIAIQAFKECFPGGALGVVELLETEEGVERVNETLNAKDKKIADLAKLWLDLMSEVNTSLKKHNESFIDNEIFGYLDDEGVWVDAADFGGEYNKKRFDSIITNIDPTLSLEEYAKTTELDINDFVNSFSVSLSDKLIKINNLYLKPGTVSSDAKDVKTSVFKGDHANAISMLETTKLGNSELEYYDNDLLEKTVFDTAGEKRKGYYCLQGASEFMITHAVQRSLTKFNSKIEKMLN